MTGARTIPRSIAVAGAGIVGLWQALTLARRGFSVRLGERAPRPVEQAASARARAKLAPPGEADAAEPTARSLHALPA